MAATSAVRWRRLVMWLHVLASVGWMAQAIVMATLTATALSSTDAPTRFAALSMAERLDGQVLAPMANVAAFTGFFLAATTPWGLTRQWWVLVKAAITLVLLYLGIFVLSGALDAAVDAAHRAADPPTAGLTVGATLMASAIAFQAWVSIVKPWGPTSWSRRGPAKLRTAPTWLLRLGVAAPAADVVIGATLRHPSPALSVLVLLFAVVHRRRLSSGTRRQDVRTASSQAAEASTTR